MKNRKSPKNTSSVLSVESEKVEKEGASLAEIEDSPGSTEGSSEGGSP